MSPLEKVKSYLAGLEKPLEVIEFPEGTTKTSEMAAQAIGVEVGQIAKTLVFIGKEKAVLVVTSGDVRVDVKKVKEYLGGKVRFAKPEECLELTGFPPGGVCPFAVKTPLPVIIDKSLERFSIVYAAAGSANSAVPVTVERLVEITKGHLKEVC